MISGKHLLDDAWYGSGLRLETNAVEPSFLDAFILPVDEQLPGTV